MFALGLYIYLIHIGFWDIQVVTLTNKRPFSLLNNINNNSIPGL